MDIPLAAFPLAKTSDPDEAQTVVSKELSELRFKSVPDRRRFQFEMNGCRLGRTMVGFNRFSTKAEVDAGVIESALIISLSVGPPTVLCLGGEVVPPGRLGVVSPAKRLTVYRSAGSGVLVLRTTIEAIRNRLREWSGKERIGPIAFDCSAGLEHGAGAQIARLLHYLVDDGRSTDTILNNPILRTGLDDMLIGAIAALSGNYGELLEEKPSTDVPRLVRQAEEFMEAHATEPITISDLVAECGCSRRALFNAFRRYRGYAPLQFLAEARLRSARDALRVAAPTSTVTSIALECGFSHLGRFAEAYRKRFGESPSDTLRRR